MKKMMEKLLELQTLEFGGAVDEKSRALIAELRGSLPAPVLGHYDRFRARGKKGLAAVSHQVCMACHMRQPLAVILTLQHGQDIQLCHNCDRYLYLPAEESPSAATAVPVTPAPRPRGTHRRTAAR